MTLSIIVNQVNFLNDAIKKYDVVVHELDLIRKFNQAFQNFSTQTKEEKLRNQFRGSLKKFSMLPSVPLTVSFLDYQIS